jgi:PPOX class probable F420-dependent enzyme
MPGLPPPARDLVDGPNTAHLATVLPDGSPHCVPLWIGTDGDRVAFFTGPDSRKARNLEVDPRVAISVVDQHQPYRMAAIRGRVTERLDGEPARAIIDRISTTYTGAAYPLAAQRVVYLVTVEHVVSRHFG